MQFWSFYHKQGPPRGQKVWGPVLKFLQKQPHFICCSTPEVEQLTFGISSSLGLHLSFCQIRVSRSGFDKNTVTVNENAILT
jgi:hypothetical protein